MTMTIDAPEQPLHPAAGPGILPRSEWPTIGNQHWNELQRRIKAAGLMEPKPAYYWAKITANLAMLAASWVALFVVGDSWWFLAVAAFMAFCYTQTGFIGHDIGHRQVTRSRRGQDLLGLLHGNLLMGFSYGWWVGHHNSHHSNPNHLEKDSDIVRRRAIFIPDQGFAEKRRKRGTQFIVRHQHLLFYPLLSTESLGLRTESLKALRARLPRLTRTETVLIVTHLALYFGTLVWVLGPLKALLFVLTMNAMFGVYIGAVFAPNHKGMPIQLPEEEWGWLTRQVVTSRNIRSSYLIDFLYGGLNYQVEHHLYPAMPRKNLRHARPITKDYCAEIGLPYHEVGVVRSFTEVIAHLYRTTKAYQALAATTQHAPQKES